MARDDITNPSKELPRRSGPVAPQDLQRYDQPSQQSADQPQGAPLRPRRKHTVLKVLALLFALYLLANLVLAMMGAAVISLGLVSCMASCSDSPIGDSATTTSFISDTAANDRDLATFDALRGCIEAVHDARAGYGSDDNVSLLSVDALRAQVAAGSWPGTSAGYGDVTDSNNPQLWVRIAELAQNHIEAQTNEQWDVVDLAYPFPDNGPIPVPATRDEDDSVEVLLVCASGKDEGLFATVDYWRWERPARFEDHVAEAREDRLAALAREQALRESGLIAGRDYLLSGSELFVWAHDDGGGSDADPLTDPQAFTDLVNAFGELTGGYATVTLFAHDTPPALGYYPLSYDYPNDRDTSFVSLETIQAALTSSHGVFYVDYAEADQLLSGYRTAEHPCEAEDLRGALVPESQTGYYDTWYRPDEGATFDDALLAVAQQSLDANAEQVIAFSKLEEDERGDATLRAWVIMERGIMPETPDEFCEASNRLRDDVWESLAPQVADDAKTSLYLRIYVVENDSVTNGGEPSSFAELREAAQTDLASLDAFDLEVALGSYPYCSLWSGDTELTRYDCEPYQVDGTVARSRSWRYGTETE